MLAMRWPALVPPALVVVLAGACSSIPDPIFSDEVREEDGGSDSSSGQDVSCPRSPPVPGLCCANDIPCFGCQVCTRCDSAGCPRGFACCPRGPSGQIQCLESCD
jgi:hypothetical protein